MYVLNYNPDKKKKFVIQIDRSGKFWQLKSTDECVVAEADSWRRLKTWAEINKLPVHFNQ